MNIVDNLNHSATTAGSDLELVKNKKNSLGPKSCKLNKTFLVIFVFMHVFFFFFFIHVFVWSFNLVFQQDPFSFVYLICVCVFVCNSVCNPGVNFIHTKCWF